MVSLAEIDTLRARDILAGKDLSQLLDKIEKLIQANHAQADLLSQALLELDQVKNRLEFYRSVTMRQL